MKLNMKVYVMGYIKFLDAIDDIWRNRRIVYASGRIYLKSL